MINALLGTKQNMSTRFTKQGFRIPVTNIVAEPNVVVSLKDTRIVLGLGSTKRSKKTENAIVKTVGHTPRFIKEVQFPQTNLNQEDQNLKKPTPGDKITVSVFEVGDEVKITGTTKGKGFAGSVKRWNFAGGPKTHGQSDRHRAPGSIGQGTTPGRVFKGKKMAGHMGDAKLTVTGLEVIEIDPTKNTLVVKGAVPGARNGFVIIQKTGKVKGYTPPPASHPNDDHPMDGNEEKQEPQEAGAQKEPNVPNETKVESKSEEAQKEVKTEETNAEKKENEDAK
jgi:large subunit ribosomal protein L3